MRAFVAALLVLSALPVASANHPGCEPDFTADLIVAGTECESGPHHDGTMYEKRVWVGLDSDPPFGFRLVVEHKYSTAAQASTCRVIVDSVYDTSVGTPCAGGHSPLLP